MNIIRKSNIDYFYEGYWRQSNDKIEYDIKGNIIPWPIDKNIPWTGIIFFIHKLRKTEEILKIKKSYFPMNNKHDCKLCDKKNIASGMYVLNKIIWDDGLLHYIEVHNYKPHNDFIDYVYSYRGVDKKKDTIKLDGQLYTKDQLTFVKLDRNQIMIMDALMRHGGYTKKYIDSKNKDIFRYSEHSGLIDFNSKGVDKIIISGKTTKVDSTDDDIYFPKNMPEAYDYEYIFHTHPPTPKPGGRVTAGILYEVPSTNDIFHFINHFNNGETQGSIVITPEGLYIIRANDIYSTEINIDDEKLYKQIKIAYRKLQHDAILKYGEHFTNELFYSQIAQDTKFIYDINQVLNKYNINIDYYPRVKDSSGRWTIDSIYLPVRIVEPIKKK